MRKLSIRMRVNIYYSAVLIISSLLVLVIFFSVFIVQKNSLGVDNVRTIVQDGFDKITYKNKVLQIGNDFDTFVKGVTLVVYSEDGNRIHGQVPTDFNGALPLLNDKVTKYVHGGVEWIVFDLYENYSNAQGVWIRGIYLEDNGISVLDDSWVFIALGVIAFFSLAIYAGKTITDKAFNPINNIIKTSEEISASRDFSKRISVPSVQDELYSITKNINNMLARLEESYMAEKEFSQDVAHELRTPITVMLAECEYNLQKEADVEKYKEAFVSIKKQCERSMGLISKLLQLTKVLDRDAALQLENIDLSQLCKMVVEEMSMLENIKDITVIGEIEDNIRFDCDEGLMMRMLMNLINNSIKYGNKNGKTLVKLYVDKNDKNSSKVVLDVIDNGIGIKEENISKIFNRFYRIDSSSSDQDNDTQFKEGYGLGLPMVKWIVNAHGGDVSVESKVGIGSTFRVTF